MRWAMFIFNEADATVIYTDSETWFGNVHPAEALRQYDKASTRVDVVMGDVHSHDLTEPLAWLME